MNHIGLFEGIGGFSLAAQWMNWKTIAYCEINPFCQKVLKYHFKEANAHEDIKTTDFSIYRGLCDIITGGFPCQPYSLAGKQKGIEDDRHLWPEMLRAIRQIRASYVLGENVGGIVNWGGGMVFNEVQSDLEAEGYEILPFLLPACSVNAPHKRERVWFIAYSDSFRQQRGKQRVRQLQTLGHDKAGNPPPIWNTLRQDELPESAVLRGDDGISRRLSGTSFPKWRSEAIKAAGNAVVPQIAFEIFKAIQSFENLNTN